MSIMLYDALKTILNRTDRHSEQAISRKIGRGERIRTSGLYVPNVALYQAKLHPDCSLQFIQSQKFAQ